MQIRDKNKNRRSFGVLALICIVLQLALAPNIGIGNGRANIAMVFAGIVSLSVGGGAGVLASFAAGVFYDLSTTGPFGLMAFLLTVMSYILGSEERNRLSDEPTESITAFAASSLVANLVYHLTMLFVGASKSFVDAVVLRTLPTFLLTLLVFAIFTHFLNLGSGNSAMKTARKAGLAGKRRGGGHYDLGKL
ncbi:rod shape-determining protein MreD [Olegusella massiliensis]|uniref:rod shape-determining protein MreD n=1 Tax=Olegusella massiliensis TaxID=1776381 RepID=UPI0008394658|nr:rod shape-determining protein MreD [Olegusella massiliensis]